MTDPLHLLEHGPLHRFADWPNPDVPNRRCGVYTVWRGDELLYVGMGGRGLHDGGDAGASKRVGLLSRLHSHASGQRSGNRFCIYVFDRLILPSLAPEQIAAAAAGTLALDALVKKLVRAELSYRFVVVADQDEAFSVERRIKQGALSGRRPTFNGVQ